MSTNETQEASIKDGLATGDTPDFKWYVVHVLSGFEGRVSKTLKERIGLKTNKNTFGALFNGVGF